jgi:hypothetical protein
MFASLKEKLAETVKNWGPQDEYDRAICSLVERATSELLISPDWGLNLEIVDMINRNPPIMEEKALRTLRRFLNKPNAKVQILALTVSPGSWLLQGEGILKTVS